MQNCCFDKTFQVKMESGDKLQLDHSNNDGNHAVLNAAVRCDSKHVNG